MHEIADCFVQIDEGMQGCDHSILENEHMHVWAVDLQTLGVRKEDISVRQTDMMMIRKEIFTCRYSKYCSACTE